MDTGIQRELVFPDLHGQLVRAVNGGCGAGICLIVAVLVILIVLLVELHSALPDIQRAFLGDFHFGGLGMGSGILLVLRRVELVIALIINRNVELDASAESLTVKVLNKFKKSFEETLDQSVVLSDEQYIDLYFEYLFSRIIKGN